MHILSLPLSDRMETCDLSCGLAQALANLCGKPQSKAWTQVGELERQRLDRLMLPQLGEIKGGIGIPHDPSRSGLIVL